MEKEKKVRWEVAGIFLILGAIAVIAVFAQRTKAQEERDRMTLEEIKEVRVAVQEYFDAHQGFPDKIPIEIPAGKEHAYQCAERTGGACAQGMCTGDGLCTNYELRFRLEYGSGSYGKGEYVADKTALRFIE